MAIGARLTAIVVVVFAATAAGADGRRVVARADEQNSGASTANPSEAPTGKTKTAARPKGKPGSEKNAPGYDYGAMNWVDPDRAQPAPTQFKTFHSKTIDGEVSYLVYLPPDYDKDPAKRYPVLYELHASGGMPASGAEVCRRLDRAVRGGRIDPLIVVMPNGLRGGTMYSDSRDGKYPVESVIVNDFVPHVDATYRTIAAREARALDGFSMGGFGAAHFGFKFPELFGVVSIMAPPLLGPDLTTGLPARAWSRLFPVAMSGDLDYFRTNDPFALVVTNADALRDRSVIRIVTHVENENWLAPRCEQLHKLLMDSRIPHQFFYLSNVKSHNRGQVLDTMGEAGLMFYGSAFAELARSKAAR